MAKLEALLTPRVIGDFLRIYDANQVPRDDIALNVLSAVGVPSDKTREVISLIIESAQGLGLIAEIKGKKYVSLKGAGAQPPSGQLPAAALELEKESEEKKEEAPNLIKPQRPKPADEARRRRVFITHGKDKSFVEPIKKLLKFGELEAVVAAERSSVSQPVPDKVMDDMRSCGAAIIHVDAEQKLMDLAAKECIVLNPNVLMDIGAAIALYGRWFILLVRSGITLPSNLQGLFEVRYEGETLGGDTTIKLLEAINDMKSKPFPDGSSIVN